MQYEFRPIEQWPGPVTKSPRRSPFKAAYRETLGLLERELNHLHARRIIVQAFLEERDVRQDGMLRANSRPRRPGVILSFDSKHGPLSYPCDAFDDWEANLRAIGLSLEALRKVDRYGVTRRSEQYTGWKKLGGDAPTPVMSKFSAAAALHGLSDIDADPGELVDRKERRDEARKLAARRWHPDAPGGDAEQFKQAIAAYDVLENGS